MHVENRIRPGIDRIQPYLPGITDDELKKLYGLQRVVKLNANENALGPSPMALRAIQEELMTLHHYPDGGSELLREAIARFHGVDVASVFVGNGSDDIIKLLSETFLNPDDEVVVPHPSFSQYGFGAAIMQAQMRYVPLQRDFSYDIEAFLPAVTEKTKFVYLCSPNNPTGTIVTEKQVQWFLDNLPTDVILILDLAYNDYSTHLERFVESPEFLSDPRVVVLHTFSKLYGLAGLRVGYGLASPELWSFVHRVREPFNVNRVGQRAAAAALEDSGHRERSQQHAASSREFFRQAAARLGIGYVETEANFALLKTGNGAELSQRLTEHGVLVRAGFAGLEDYMRVTFGTPEENQLWLAAMEAVYIRS